MIEIPGIKEVVLAATELIPSSAESKRQKTRKTLLNIIEGRIQNPNTRRAYKNAWKKFFEFCSEYKLALDRLEPFHLGMFLRRHLGGVATQRQHLSAIRLLFDELLEQGVVELNPAARTKPPRLQRESSHTPVFEAAEIKAFLGAIKLECLRDVRDKALFCVLAYSWARVSAVAALNVEDYFERKGTRWLRFQEKRGKIHEVPVHSEAREAVDRWIAASGLGPSAPLFPAFAPDKQTFAKDKETNELRHLDRGGIFWLLQARAKASGLEKKVCVHSFRATGITEYLNAGGSIHIAKRIAGHSQLSTTQIYDHSGDGGMIAAIEKVSYSGVNIPTPAP